ncbi:acyltransferase family protein [Bordetella genomosp. 11]|uniref:Acyltransferase 3 domain-containing protein n=1 Tax=Bordetella genomosp. 11 TaxID=1416808 RepID=A0A261UCB1_9BORD|nr:acyltransferase [Bordetella genomosp. 11]OZI59578.1 hypothetical protein CAL28_08615 [Bordetella genomosp. 11]
MTLLTHSSPSHINEKPAPGKTVRHLPALTPLRGIAALWVVLYHYGVLYFPNIHPDRHTALLNKGYLAVDLFFMLSGFVMMHVYREEFASRVSPRGYWTFLSARIARIYPLHLAVLGLFLLIALGSRVAEHASGGLLSGIPLYGVRSLFALLANLFMLQGIHASTLSWNYAAWSISLEFMAYLAFPFVATLVWRSGWRAQALPVLGAFAVLALLAWLTHDDYNQWDGWTTFMRCIPEFLLGMLLYQGYAASARGALPSRDALALAAMAALLAALHFQAPDLLTVVLLAALLVAVASNRGRAAAWLDNRVFVWLGEISYALYLVHGLVQHATTQVLSLGVRIQDRQELSSSASIALMAVMLAISLLLATACSHAIEKPAQRYLRGVLSGSGSRVAQDSNPRPLGS